MDKNNKKNIEQYGINERLDELIKALGYNINSFANELGLKGPAITNLLPHGRRSLPGYTTTYKILTRFSSVNPEWLMLGEGTMFKEESSNDNSATEQLSTIQREMEHYQKLLASYEKTIDAKDGEIATLKELVSILKQS